jgi:hypothetical protein
MSEGNTPKVGSSGDSLDGLVRKYCHWRVRKELPDEYLQFVDYHSNCGPVTAEHVRTSPSVQRWLGEDKLVCIYPPSNPKDAIHYPRLYGCEPGVSWQMRP